MKSISLFTIFTLVSLPLGPLSARAASGDPGAEKTAIINNAKAFVDAFEKGDAKAVATFWAEDGDYVDLDGRQLQGRTAIEDAFKEFFKENKGMKLRIDVKSVRFVAPDVAIEDGTSSVIPPDGAPPNQGSYTNVHVKKGGQWVLQSVREAPYTPPGNYAKLHGLEWAVGEWVDEGDGPEIGHVTLEWSDDGNFLISTQDVTVKDTLVARATSGSDGTRPPPKSALGVLWETAPSERIPGAPRVTSGLSRQTRPCPTGRNSWPRISSPATVPTQSRGSRRIERSMAKHCRM